VRTVLRAVGIAVALALLPAFAVPVQEPVDQVDPSLEAVMLTRDSQDIYSLTVDDDTITAAAPPSNRGANSRMVFRPTAAIPTVNQMSCATWEESPGHVQQGAGLRMQHGLDGGFRALMITKNIWNYSVWTFNIHLVDTSSDQPLTMLAQIPLEEVFFPEEQVAPGPWRMCAAAVGSEVAVKVWPVHHKEPEWGDERYGAIVDLPAGWDHRGHAGWYIGHLHAGDSATFSDATTTGQALDAVQRQLRQDIAAAAVVLRP
jgi:hypothetical protein